MIVDTAAKNGVPPPPADSRSYTTAERWALAQQGWIFTEVTAPADKDKRFQIEGRYHRPYWLTFNGRAAACMEAPTEEEAREDATALTGCEVLTVKSLPYPANPRLRAFDHPQYGSIPALCMHGDKCAGRGSCPRPYSCSE